MRKNVVKIVVVLALAIILSGLCLVFTACEEEVEISPINEDDYIVSNGLLGYVK